MLSFYFSLTFHLYPLLFRYFLFHKTVAAVDTLALVSALNSSLETLAVLLRAATLLTMTPQELALFLVGN
jgi:hypothetical protein